MVILAKDAFIIALCRSLPSAHSPLERRPCYFASIRLIHAEGIRDGLNTGPPVADMCRTEWPRYPTFSTCAAVLISSSNNAGRTIPVLSELFRAPGFEPGSCPLRNPIRGKLNRSLHQPSHEIKANHKAQSAECCDSSKHQSAASKIDFVVCGHLPLPKIWRYRKGSNLRNLSVSAG